MNLNQHDKFFIEDRVYNGKIFTVERVEDNGFRKYFYCNDGKMSRCWTDRELEHYGQRVCVISRARRIRKITIPSGKPAVAAQR